MQGGAGEFDLPHVNHVGVVVRDMDEVGRSLRQVFGREFDQEFEYTAEGDALLAGEPFTLRIAAVNLGGAVWETRFGPIFSNQAGKERTTWRSRSRIGTRMWRVCRRAEAIWWPVLRSTTRGGRILTPTSEDSSSN
jgi:hypothetical protein